MSLKIEKIAVYRKSREGGEFAIFCRALGALKVGESFVYRMSTYNRMAVSAISHAMSRQFSAAQQKEEGIYRVGRVE